MRSRPRTWSMWEHRGTRSFGFPGRSGIAHRKTGSVAMNGVGNGSPEAKDAEQAADLLVTVATTLNERLAVTADELARSQAMLREASEELMTAFRGAADRIVAA